MTGINEVHFEGKIAQKAIIAKDGKVLVLLDPLMDKIIWEIPGGRLNINENPQVGLQREIFEELGVTINVGEVVHMEQFIQGSEGKRAFVIVYVATLQDEQADLVLNSQEVSEVRWIDENDLDNIVIFPEYLRALRCYFENYNK